MRVVEIEAVDAHDLRRRVLREGRPDADVSFPEDHVAGALHLGVTGDHGALLAVASFSPQAAPHRPGARAVRLRGLAVEPQLRQAGVGRMLVGTAAERLRSQGYEVLWANGRDNALGFYRRLGWQVLAKGFVMAGHPHHVVSLEL
ncbi:MAG TPA: GNAT family N-acetyltransferase [Acidimicrobiales bacterium]|nr:GNAT family N-acetyltransferase [Acidimicrobiales bacterium]